MPKFQITDLLLKKIFLAACFCYIGSISISTITFYHAQSKIEKITLTEIPKNVNDEIKNNIDKAKSDVIGAIAVPIISTIASIFAAFIVKDFFWVKLNSEEKEKIKNELKASITNEFPKVLKDSEFSRRLHLLEIYVNWLDHESFRATISTLIESTENLTTDPKTQILINELVEKGTRVLHNSSNLALKRVRDDFNHTDLNKLQEIENKYLFSNHKIIELNSVNQSLISDIESNSSRIFERSFDDPLIQATKTNITDSLFERQILLLISKLIESGNTETALEFFQYISKERIEDREKLRKEAREIRERLPERSLSEIRRKRDNK